MLSLITIDQLKKGNTMIIDKIENINKYECLEKGFGKVFELLKNQTYNDKNPGKYELYCGILLEHDSNENNFLTFHYHLY